MEAIEQGYIQNEIAISAYRYQKIIESGEQIIVGLNAFINTREVPLPSFKIHDNIRIAQTQRLNILKQKRNNIKIISCLKAVEDAARGTENLMPLVIDAVENYCTLGEISDTLRRVFGEFK